MNVTGCFFCGEPDGSLANNPNEYFKPCTVCNAMMNLGTVLLGYTMTPNGHPPIATKKDAPSLYPTGKWLVLEPGVGEKMLAPDIAKRMVESKKNLVEDSIITSIKTLADHDYTIISAADAEKIQTSLKKMIKSPGGNKNES